MTRSNRGLTQFATNKIRHYLKLGRKGFFNECVHNTSVTLSHEHGIDFLEVCLHGNSIIELAFNEDKKLIDLAVRDGNFYDMAGRPSRTTRERLNGILGFLGENSLIPPGVRVFLDPETKQTFLGMGEQRLPFGRKNSEVVIESHPSLLKFL